MSYIIEASWLGTDYDLRRKLVTAAHRAEGGSGFDFTTRRYDITWHFRQRPAAERLLGRLREAAPRRVRLRLIDLSKPGRPPTPVATAARRKGRARLARARRKQQR